MKLDMKWEEMESHGAIRSCGLSIGKDRDIILCAWVSGGLQA